MSRQPRRDTAPELTLRRALHAVGLRYRVAYPVPGRGRRTIDIAFTRVRVAVFVDGCFWHGCPEHGTWPAANGTWWRAKLETNVARDVDTSRLLHGAGWLVLRYWEHDDLQAAACRVAEEVASRSAQLKQAPSGPADLRPST